MNSAQLNKFPVSSLVEQHVFSEASLNVQILLSAFGIHTGGGLVLLKALIQSLEKNLKVAALDVRFLDKNITSIPKHVCIERIRRSFPSRIAGLNKLVGMMSKHDVLLCFNSLPPLRKSMGKVIIYVQAPHFIGAHRGLNYSYKTALRIWIERCWFKFGITNCDEIWVQTRTVSDTIRAQYPSAVVMVVPFVDEDIASHLINLSSDVLPQEHDGSEFIFFYPADGVGHKNHANLMKAWELLKQEGKCPKLLLTLEVAEFDAVFMQKNSCNTKQSNIINLGRISREDVLIQLQNCSALIFPSQAETFGLPMLEARAFEVPVLASERDFVRDVCLPVQTFDPNSPRSIAMAVARFMDGSTAPRVNYYSALQFVNKLIQ